MSAAKPTPGPWKAQLEDRLLCDGIQISGADGEPIAYVQPDDTMEIEGGRIVECCSATQKANGRLIAAAPEFLEVLKDFVLDHDNGLGPSVDRLRAALAKAEGK